MSGPPIGALPPLPDLPAPARRVLSDVFGRAEVEEFAAEAAPGARFRAAFKRGDEWVEEEFVRVEASYGGDRSELYYPDGRHVTVRSSEELAWLAEEVSE